MKEFGWIMIRTFQSYRRRSGCNCYGSHLETGIKLCGRCNYGANYTDNCHTLL